MSATTREKGVPRGTPRGRVWTCSMSLDRAARVSLTPCMADEAALKPETVTTPYGEALRCTGISKTTGKQCAKAARHGAKTCAIHGPAGSGCWSRTGYPEDPRLWAEAGGASRASPSEVIIAFLAAQERTLRIRRQAAEVDSISLDLARALVEGMVSVLARYVPPERELAALDSLYAWQASLVPGIVRL